jgi:hypothetical protein
MAVSPPSYLANLRDVRVRAQEITMRAKRIQRALVLKDPAARLIEVTALFSEESVAHQDDVWNIGDRLAKARDSMETNPGSLEDSGDLLTTIELKWSRALSHWPQWAPTHAAEADLAGLKSDLADAVRDLHELIILVGKATIPYRLERWLEDVRVGGQLDFAAAFKDELEQQADQRAILEFLASAPAASGGLIDVPTGRIYRISPSRRRQWRSYLLMASVVIAGGVLVWLLCVWGPSWNVAGWPFSRQRLNDMLIAYVAVLAGGLLHILIDALKEYRKADRSGSLFALDDLWLWGHVRERSISTAIVVLIAVTIGLGAIPGVQLGFLTALFAGYSADSIIDLFLQRFDTFSKGQISALDKAIGPVNTAASDGGDL